MDVTVLIRCYKQEQYLYDCVRRLGDVLYRILSDYPQMGKRKRLNEAIQEVTTEFIAFNDADDMSTLDRFHNIPDNVDVVYSDYYELSESCRLVKSREFDRELLKQENYIPFSTIIIRTELAQQVPFEADYKGNFEDWIWLNNIAQKTDKFSYRPFPTTGQKAC